MALIYISLTTGLDRESVDAMGWLTKGDFCRYRFAKNIRIANRQHTRASRLGSSGSQRKPMRMTFPLESGLGEGVPH